MQWGRLRAVVTVAAFAAALAAGVLRAQGQGPVPITPLVERAAVHPGSGVRALLKVALPDGLHIQSDQPRDATLIPTAVRFRPAAGVTVTEVVYPGTVEFSIPGVGDAQPVFEKTVLIGVVMRVAEDAPLGALSVPAQFTYQACDDRQCYVPRRVEIAWTLQVVPATSPLPPAEHRVEMAAVRFGTGAPPTVLSAGTPPVVTAASTGSPAEVVALFDQFEIRGTGAYMTRDEFLTFVRNAESGVRPARAFDGQGPLAILALVFLGGLALNLTPCVLPMIPINLAIIGAGAERGSRRRGLVLGSAYGAAMAAVYGLLGLVVILTAGTFGAINASPWFNLGLTALFVILGLAMFEVINIDFSRLSSRIRFGQRGRGSVWLAFAMGAVAALLAGACVAPVVIQVVVFASERYAAGVSLALALPFVLGLGMALPWPLAGAGIAALPKPGAWMVRVKQAMGVFILATAAYYGYVAYAGFANRWVDPATVSASVQAKLQSGWTASLGGGLSEAARDRKPVLLDFWATWCKNCLVMDETTLVDPDVVSAVSGYVKIKVQTEDPDAMPQKELLRRLGAIGLPAYAILLPR